MEQLFSHISENSPVETRVAQPVNTILVNTISPHYLVRYQGPLAINILAAYVGRKAESALIHRVDMQENFEKISADSSLSMSENFQNTVRTTSSAVCDIAKTQEGPTVVGISIKWATVEVAQEIINQVRELCGKQILFVLGNIGSTFGYEELLKIEPFKDTLAVVGEGEDALTFIVNKAAENADQFTNPNLYTDIPNVVTNIQGTPTLKSTARVDLTHYPENLHTGADIYDKSWDVHCLETSRGCPWGHCTFCSVNSQFGDDKNSGWVPFPIEMVLNNVRRLADQGVRNFDIKDSEFFGPVRPMGKHDPFDETIARVQSFARGMSDINSTLDNNDKATIHHMSARVDTIYKTGEDERNNVRETTYRMLKEAGVKGVYLGIESGSQSQLRRFGKGVTPEENKKAIEIMRRLGFEFEVGFIFFDYLATMQELKDNVDFIEATKLYENDSRILGGLRVQEGSPYKQLVKNHGLLGSKHADFLGYKCSFLHPDVEKLEKIFIQWEKGTVKLIRLLPPRLRLEVRKMDFMLMKELVDDFLNNAGENSESILNKYRSKILQFLAQVRNDADVKELNKDNIQLLENYLEFAEKTQNVDSVK